MSALLMILTSNFQYNLSLSMYAIYDLSFGIPAVALG